MEEQVNRLVKKTWDKFLSTPETSRLMIAISGVPGSGKTSLAIAITKRINELYAEHSPGSPPIAAFVPMDGYHLTRAELAAMPDPVFAAARRGAHFTFNADKFLQLVKLLREPLTATTSTVYAPSFDHAVKDPVENDIPILATARVLIFEGNYLSLNKDPWNQAAALMDELWFVEVDFEIARQRLIKRHVEAGIAKNEEEADKRARENDLLNGQEIVDFRLPVDEVIVSTFDEKFSV
ncbi:kinase-related protein [Talaromyces stipitatus ATCC 10500]|uniref:Kinase-related protein n=1 Tax=Talaromyces stipitatus (strain ATCC 10500 / CBS 375.48 / QM 6759 / NRRL 1006) TaxID=441959 RepID=B8LTT7_TALSN|nr:kinase-related protein [Talaromyces stipitatus ATCC 10500]XP_002341067.1 kinase-related protein [Talaromyces stipitatus ATCC 10500]EED23679.1 kinase-related protein [Talaromyces stipitatus ATCC 10500]EED23680.1 kinase-related protein [Talaromyces stipitatus ATCC 10500]